MSVTTRSFAPRSKSSSKSLRCSGLPLLHTITLNMERDAKTYAKVLENALDHLTHDRRSARAVFAARAIRSRASSCRRDALGVSRDAPRAPCGSSWTADLIRSRGSATSDASARARFERPAATSRLVSRADHLPEINYDDATRSGPRRRDHHDCSGQRAGRSAAARPRHVPSRAVLAAPEEKRSSVQKKSLRLQASRRRSSGADYTPRRRCGRPLLGLSQFRPLPICLREPRARMLYPRHDQEILVVTMQNASHFPSSWLSDRFAREIEESLVD